MTTPTDKPVRTRKSAEEFEVGYKKPPKQTQFAKGKSGNTKGRPKRSRNLVVLINEELDKPVILQENGKPVQLSKREALAKRLVNQGLNGEARAMAALIGMDKDDQELDDKVTELSPEDQAQFERFTERAALKKIVQMRKAAATIEGKKP